MIMEDYLNLFDDIDDDDDEIRNEDILISFNFATLP